MFGRKKIQESINEARDMLDNSQQETFNFESTVSDLVAELDEEVAQAKLKEMQYGIS